MQQGDRSASKLPPNAGFIREFSTLICFLGSFPELSVRPGSWVGLRPTRPHGSLSFPCFITNVLWGRAFVLQPHLVSFRRGDFLQVNGESDCSGGFGCTRSTLLCGGSPGAAGTRLGGVGDVSPLLFWGALNLVWVSDSSCKNVCCKLVRISEVVFFLPFWNQAIKTKGVLLTRGEQRTHWKVSGVFLLHNQHFLFVF